MRKRGFTLIELLVVLAIIGILLALIIPAVMSVGGKGSWYSHHETFIAKVVNARQFWDSVSHKTDNRIDVKRAVMTQSGLAPATSAGLTPSGLVEVLDNSDDPGIQKYTSESIQANAEPGWYQIETVGYRDERRRYYPNIVRMARIPDPPPVAEIGDMP